MKHRFSYVQAGIWSRPIIPITLKHKTREINYLALLDSGADFNIFHAEIADLLRIDLSKLKTSMSFGGIKEGAQGEGYFTSLNIGIEKTFFTSPVVFSSEISNNGYGILGQQGFFNNCIITFDYSKKEILLEL